MKNIALLLYTARHLKLRQVFYRGYYFAKRRLKGVGLPQISEAPQTRHLKITQPIPRPRSSCGTDFTFLNRSHDFKNQVDWNFPDYGKLWCYNLNYFDFLNQEGMEKEAGVSLMNDFINHAGPGSVGFEPYPTSLRLINWIKFVCRHEVRDRRIDGSLYVQVRHLSKNLEYHLLGNHLLENGFALLIAACYFADERLYRKARKILAAELAEQVLPDGSHFELSPMYHQIILDRLLDCINFLRYARPADDLLVLLEKKASAMIGWITTMTFQNGDIPLFNDAVFGIAPTTAELSAYAARLRVAETSFPLNESGYRKITKDRYEIIVDVGNIGPDYIPGHAHSDTFNFVLYRDGKPFIVDTGTSTYETCGRRLAERRTASHNTVQVDGLEQSVVWGSFRVAQRAYVRDLVETENTIAAWHTGYDRIGARHRREFVFNESRIVISDTVESQKTKSCHAYLHFHPDVEVTLGQDQVIADGAKITFTGASKVTLEEYLYAPRFNVLHPAKCVRVAFTHELKTTLSLAIEASSK